MCMVSVVHTYHQKLQPDYWTPVTFDQFKDFLKQAEKYDELTDQKDCLDPQKAEFLKDVEKMLLEKYGMEKMFEFSVGMEILTVQERTEYDKKSFQYSIVIQERTRGIVKAVRTVGLAQWVEVEFDLLKNVVSYYTANSRKDPLTNQIKPVLYDGKTNLEVAAQQPDRI